MFYTFPLYNLGAKTKLKHGMSSTEDPLNFNLSRLGKCPRQQTIHDCGLWRGSGHLCTAFKVTLCSSTTTRPLSWISCGLSLSAIMSLSPLLHPSWPLILARHHNMLPPTQYTTSYDISHPFVLFLTQYKLKYTWPWNNCASKMVHIWRLSIVHHNSMSLL